MTLYQPDRELAERAAAGDAAAWRSLYDATRDRLFALTGVSLRPAREALDLLQETYLAAWRALSSYRGEGRLESWLVGIALRRARDWKRRFLPWRRNAADLEELERRPARPDPPPPELNFLLQRALARLPERQRSAFLLHEWLGYSFEEIGPLLGIAPATARVHAFRARQTLGAELKEPTDVAPTGARFQESES
jgi:RNA polymerase sigma-70 factor (ECF subfamily)